MIEIRKVTEDDVTVLYDLIMAIAVHHQQQQYVLTCPEELLAAGFVKSPKYGAHLAEYEGTTAGFISYTHDYSIWLGADYLRIDDLYVLDEFRGNKIGEALMNHVAESCKAQGIDKIKWEVQSDNLQAIRFYQRLGAELNSKGVFTWILNDL